jgi:hypothetical protein
MSTLLPLRSTSVMESLLERDMIAVVIVCVFGPEKFELLSVFAIVESTPPTTPAILDLSRAYM